MIGYYIHHVGRGHLQHAGCVAAHFTEEVTGLSSLQEPPGWPGQWITLPRDDTGGPPVEPSAGGQLHWAPLRDAGLRDRMAAIAAWIQHADPSAFMIDVSVEVSALARLMGVPVVVPVLPGVRNDPAHRLGYGLAEQLIAPWPAFISPALLFGMPERTAEIQHVGAFSRFDGRAPDGKTRLAGNRTVMVLQGNGGTTVTDQDVREAAASTPGWSWTVLGGDSGRWEEDPWAALCRADVIVTHAGLSALAEVAAARKPAIIIPQARPHAEQVTTSRALASAGLAITAESWPAGRHWATLLGAALDLGGDRWGTWSSGTGARQAAELIENLNCRNAGTARRCAARS
ncbi:MAG: glycosyltransferase [Actinomycetota bacterium]